MDAEELVAAPGLRIVGEDANVRRRQANVQERQAHHEEHAQRRQEKEEGTTHDPERRAVPEAHPARPGPGQATRVDAVAEHGQEGGQEGQREHDAERDDDDAAHAHGEEVRPVEEEQPREPGGDGHAGEAHDAARRRHGARERLAQVSARRELLAVTAHDEERVVDGDARADERADVDGVLRDLGDAGEGGHDRDAAHDGERADADRKGGRGDGPEHVEEHEERERERDHLGADQVVLEDAIEIVHVRDAAGAIDGQAVRVEPGAHGGVGGQRLAVVAGHRDDRELGAPRTVDERGRVRLGEIFGRDHRDHARIVVKRSQGGAGGVGERWIARVDALGVEDGDERRLVVAPRHRGDDLARLPRFEPVDHAGDERPASHEDAYGEHEQGPGGDQHGPSVAKDEGAEPLEHHAPPALMRAASEEHAPRRAYSETRWSPAAVHPRGFHPRGGAAGTPA